MKPSRACMGVFAAVLVLGSGWAPECRAGAKNVIICVADGGGFNAYAAGSYYQYGRLGCQPYDQAGWVKLASRTFSLNTVGKSFADEDRSTMADSTELIRPASKAPFEPPAVWDPRVDLANTMSLATGASFKGYTLLKSSPTDSAASATAMSSGNKTLNGRLNFVPDDFGSESPIRNKTAAEIAKSLGKSAGVVTTVQWNDATPAGLGGAHSIGRGIRRDIANEMLSSGTLDVIMGSGHPEYDRYGAPVWPAKEADYDIAGGLFTWKTLKNGTHSRGWKMIENRAQFEALMSGPTPSRVFGLVKNLAATQHERPTRDWNGDGKVDAADIRVAPPFKDPFLPNSPSLAVMARGAINVLSKNPKGFYLMVEGGAVDHAGHSNQPGRLIEEQIDFNNAVKAVVEWVEKHSNWEETLVIVTADHETGMLWGSNSDREAFDRMMPRGAGRAPGMWFNTTGHSNSLVPMRARGAGASQFSARILGTDPVYGEYVDNTSIYEVMAAALNGTTVETASSGGSEFMEPSSPMYSGEAYAAPKPTKKKSSTTKPSTTRPARKTTGGGTDAKSKTETEKKTKNGSNSSTTSEMKD